MTDLKFYFDTNVSRDVSDRLHAAGVDVVRCEDVGMYDAKDVQHLEYATDENRVMVSHDQDFLRLDADWKANGKMHAGIFFLNDSLQGKVGPIYKALKEYVELVVEGAAVIETDIANQVKYIR